MPINTYNLPFETRTASPRRGEDLNNHDENKQKDDQKVETTDEHFGFEFPLSDFQKHAIDGLLHGHHVLVCAPTGSGKTLPAEFAIRHFVLTLGKKVVYTSPIKALSNQKFHEFSRKFPDISVGLCTGDIKTNPSAQLLLVTAEILNNAIFLSHNHNGNQTNPNNPSSSVLQLDIANDLGCVIMDEVHYINDADRGHVWEQTIMTLPAHIQMLMLSATLDGPLRFASWIEDTKKPNGGGGEDEERPEQKQVVLAGTIHRIVPLTHYIFLPTTEAALKTIGTKSVVQRIRGLSNRLIEFKSAKKQTLNEETYQSMEFVLKTYEENRLRINRQHTLNSLAQFMKGKEDPDVDDCLLPAIVFVFSRKQVEQAAHKITQSLWPFDAKEPYTIARTCEQFLRAKLPNYREYLVLPEYQQLVQLLEKGVGIHHSGMIPILREIVELLIAQKSIRLLFATESFAIGLDCPIRTAVFTGVQKPDGDSSFRFLLAHEYTQMAGRAGRRGIDTVGHAILLPTLFSRSPSWEQWKAILSNTPQRLESKFQMDYRMVLSLIKKGQRNAFHDFAKQSMIMDVWSRQVKNQHQFVQTCLAELEAKERHIRNALRTPTAKCEEFVTWTQKRQQSVNKKRKEAERALQTLQNEFKYVEEDARAFEQVIVLREKWTKAREELEAMELYAETEVNHIVRILVEEGFLVAREVDDLQEKKYYFTEKGELASRLAEIHPLVMTDFIFVSPRIEDDVQPIREKTTEEWISILTACCDVRIPEEKRAVQRDNKDFLQLESILHKYMDREREANLYISSQQTEFQSDLCEYMGEWAKAEDEETCRIILQRVREEKDVSTGDFVKAILKICALAREIGSACGQLGLVEIEHALSLVDARMLKYVATSQSLYL